jgi:hypothetical protein
MNRTEFMEMHANGVAALAEYFIEAQSTAAMLAECTEEPLKLQRAAQADVSGDCRA